MDISDFLPKYPNINQAEDDLLNPYDDFYNSIFRKKEFYDNRYIKDSPKTPLEKGDLFQHQKIVAHFLSSNTMYNSLLLVHEMGSGKTCSAIGAIEQIKNEHNNFRGAYIFAKGTSLLDNFIKELRDKCTAGQYVPEGFVENAKDEKKKYGGLTEQEAVIRTRKLYEDYYHFKIGPNKPTTFETFAKHVKKMADADIISTYSNHIIVIDEVHNLRESQDKESEKMYEQFHRFLHLIKNCKVLLLSGTPMKDTPDEISSVMNLMLPLDEQMQTGAEFIKRYLDVQGKNLYSVKAERIPELKEKFKGLISFAKAIKSNVKKEYIGEKIGALNHLIVNGVKMSKFQSEHYHKAVELDSKGKVEDENKKTGVHYNARQASLFVFPDGSYGGGEKKGFNKYVVKKEQTQAFSALKLKGNVKQKAIYSYTLIKELVDNLKGKNNEETLKNLERFSCKYASVIRSILDAKNQCCFVYSELVTGSGSILFSKILELFTIDGKNFTEANGKETKNGIRYGLLTFKTASSKKIHNIINRFNRDDNIHGDVIKVLIGSKVVSEGVSFFNIQQEYIMTPWFNYSETDQAIARGFRAGSHKALIEAGENPVLHISQMAAIPNKTSGIDLDMYKLSEDKDITIQGILRLMMESAIDCSLNYFRNSSPDGFEGKRECEYQDCNYVCTGVDTDQIIEGLKPEDIDYSTFQLYYSDPKVNDVRKKIDKLFKKYNELDFKTILNNLENEHTEQEIRNALTTLIQRKGDKMTLKDYNKIYGLSNVRKIMSKVEVFFRFHFKLNFDRIVELLNTDSSFTQFEIITALKNMIDENIIIKNKYGFPSYLRENNNVYFLVNGLSIKSDPLSDYYSKVPNIITHKRFEDILGEVQTDLMPVFIEKLSKITKQNAFSRLIKAVPEEIQEMFIESAILSQQKKIELSTDIRKFILEYFVNYIHDIEGVWVSNRLNDGETLRCLEKGKEKWKDCDETFDEKIKQKESQRKNILETNPWGYYGKYNPEKNTFNIVNVKEQLKKQEDDLKKKIEELDALVKTGEITEDDKKDFLEDFSQDARNVYSGKNCNNWAKPSLQKIAILTLKLDYPEDFRDNSDKEELREEVKKIKNISFLYDDEETIDKLKTGQLKRTIFWMSKENKIDELCKAIKNWFANTKWKGVDMLIPDKQIGGYGHKKKEKTEEKKIDFRIESIIPKNDPEKFKTYAKDIEKLINECFNRKDYKAEIDSKRWVLTFRKSKLVSVLALDSKNVIWNVCVAKNYRRQGIGKKSLEEAVGYSCPAVNPKLYVDNTGKTYTKLIKMYTEYGFTIISNDGKTTTMEFKCS